MMNKEYFFMAYNFGLFGSTKEANKQAFRLLVITPSNPYGLITKEEYEQTTGEKF